MDQDPIRQKIRKRLDDGTLPREVPPLTKGGPEQPSTPLAPMKADSAIGLTRYPGCDAEGAQEYRAGKVYRLGALSAASRYRLLPKALRELGYVEGQNLTIEWRFADGDAARLPDLAADLVRLNVDVILATFMPEILAAKQATSSIPIVMISSVDPVGNGLVASLARPGGNVTGMTIQPPEFGGKQVELIKQAVPKLSRLAVVWDPLYPGFMAFYKYALQQRRSASRSSPSRYDSQVMSKRRSPGSRRSAPTASPCGRTMSLP